MKTLTSMTDFVLEQSEILHKDQKNRNFNLGMLDFATNSIKYARFLKQPLAVYQFVPCKLVDGEWVVLEEPCAGMYGYDHVYKEYQEALDEVLFEGFEVCNRQSEFICIVFKDGYLLLKNLLKETIEYLVPYNLQLTKTALKEIGL